jgi:hypothetical protein
MTGLDGQLPAVLLDSLGGAQEADDGVFPLGALIRRTSGGFTSGVICELARAGCDAPAGTPRSPGARARNMCSLAPAEDTSAGPTTARGSSGQPLTAGTCRGRGKARGRRFRFS